VTNLSVKLDDPSFNAPIYANLFDAEDGDGYTLIWSRAKGGMGTEPHAPWRPARTTGRGSLP
jgi:Protein of unknown function (DUF736)